MKLLKPRFHVDWVNHCKVPEDDDGGLGLQLSAEVNELVCELFTVVSDNSDDSLWVEFYIDDHAVRVPYATVKDAIDIAPTRVFSSADYKRRANQEEPK
jgi:hypothetical protein